MKLPAVFAIIVSVAMIGQWVMSYVTKKIPEVETEPWRIGFHIAGEMATAISLIVGGSGLLVGMPWAPTLFAVSMGMLLYTAIVSPGYFVQRGQWVWVLVFGALIALAIVAIVAVSGSVSRSA